MEKGYLKKKEQKENKRDIHLTVTKKADKIIEDGRAAQKLFDQTIMKGFTHEDRKALQAASAKVPGKLSAVWRGKQMNRTDLLGSGSIKSLFFRLTIPAVVAQVISLLYNIVDRIYIGHMAEVGQSALTGAGLFVPILLLTNAFAMLVASGGAPLMSIRLGEGQKEKAEKIMWAQLLH